MVCGTDADKTAKAIKWIKDLTREFEAGEIFMGKVVRFLDFGAFVELVPGRDGMVHVSELAPYRVSKPENFLKLGDEVAVKIIEIDEMGRVNLTMKGLEQNQPLWVGGKGKETGSFGFGNSSNGGRSRFSDRRSNDRRGSGPDRRPRFKR